MYPWLLALHLISLIVWLGPSVGGTYIYLRARRTGKQDLILWTLRESIALYNLEHIAFAGVLISGVGLLVVNDWALLSAQWIRWKLLFVAGLIIPVEVWDVVIINRILPRALSAKHINGACQQEQLSKAMRAHDLVLTLGGVTFTLGVIGAFFSAILKP